MKFIFNKFVHQSFSTTCAQERHNFEVKADDKFHFFVNVWIALVLSKKLFGVSATTLTSIRSISSVSITSFINLPSVAATIKFIKFLAKKTCSINYNFYFSQ